MIQTQLYDVYRLMGESIKFYSFNNGTPLPNTFAVINNEKDLANESLGYPKEIRYKPHYYSRRWEIAGYNPSEQSIMYPVVAVYEEAMIHKNIFVDGRIRYWQLSLNCLIKNWDHVKDDNLFSSQDIPYYTKSEAFVHAENILISMFKYLEQAIIATTTDDATPKLYNETYLIFKKANVSGFNYTLVQNTRGIFAGELASVNGENKVFAKQDISSLNAINVEVMINIPKTCFTQEFTWAYRLDYPVGYDRIPGFPQPSGLIDDDGGVIVDGDGGGGFDPG